MLGFLSPAAIVLLLVSLPLPGQSSACAPGFAAEPVMTETSQAWLMRGQAFEPSTGDWYWGLGRTVFRRPDPWTWLTAHQFVAPEEIGLLVRPAGQRLVWFTELNSGAVFAIDPAQDRLLAPFAGVANAFDLAVGPGGEVLVSANPGWPQPGASSGIWHVGPGHAGREILRLNGPSGPLLFDGNGNLLVAELGPVVPPPAGAVRILRFPPARWQQALAGGGVLVPADADAISTGWDGAYDLAADDFGRLYVTDPASTAVPRTLPGSLQRDPVPACVVPHPGLQLQFVPGGPAPFAPFQPAAHAGALLIGNGNFTSQFRVHRLAPERPALALSPGNILGPGPATLLVSGAPASGFALLAVTLHPPRPEWIVAAPGGLPIWSAFDTSASFITVLLVLDVTGAGSLSLVHPGGFSDQLHFQALAFGPAGTQVHGSTAPLTVLLLP